MNTETARPEISQTPDQRLRTGAIVPRHGYGVLRLTGADRVDFLQRMTTNHIAALKSGQSAVTVLTSPTARILFVFTVLCRDDDLLLLTAGPDHTDALAKHLRGQIFFMDQVSVHPEPEQTRLRLLGDQAQELLARWHDGLSQLADQAFTVHADAIILRQTRFDVPGFELIVPANSAAGLVTDLAAAGFQHVDVPAAYDALRIEQGRPAVGRELVEDYTPLETDLAWTCAENKGCYTGQEIIARQITYDKVTRHLAGLVLDGPAEPGATLLVEGKAVGTLTSSAYSPTLACHIALAVIRRATNTAGQPVVVQSDALGATHGRVVALPMQPDAVSAQVHAE